MMHPSFPAAKLVSSSYVFSLLPVSQFHNLSSLTDSSTTTGSQFNWRFIHRIAVLPKKVQRRQWQSTPVLLPGKQRSLVGCSPWGRQESYTTERLCFHFSLSCIGEGNGNPLQCSCLENPRDGGAWWAAVYGVAQSQTRLKRLSSSSSKKGLNKGNN